MEDSTDILSVALEYLDRGWSIIPVIDKRPAIKWKEYQQRRPHKNEVMSWWSKWPSADIALVTGEISGIYVVDQDNESAVEWVNDNGYYSPVQVSTPHGRHNYFTVPRDNKRRGPRVGANSTGRDWPQVSGLDFRGDGSYAVLPPSRGYVWSIPPGDDWTDADFFHDWGGDGSESSNIFDIQTGEAFDFSALDMSDLKVKADGSVWERTRREIEEHHSHIGKLPSGGRNHLLVEYISECIITGHWGEDVLLSKADTFMSEFFLEHLPIEEATAAVQSIMSAERRNHPERFNSLGEYIFNKERVVQEEVVVEEDLSERRFCPIVPADAENLIDQAENQTFLLSPLIRRGTITQIHGYSGHGKSMFVQNALYCLAVGRDFGCFEVKEAKRVLYFNFEEGGGTIGRNLKKMQESYGHTDNFMMWAPFIDDERSIDLHTTEGLLETQRWIELNHPDVVVIDTIRTAWPGLQENSAEEWGRINKFALHLRNAGYAVILIHHSNKPGEGGLGREAGSTNQLTVLESQMRIAQVYKDEETAKQNAGIYDGSYPDPPWYNLERKLPGSFKLALVLEARFKKVREWTDEHQSVQFIGFGINEHEEWRVVSSLSMRQKARAMRINPTTPMVDIDIARTLMKPLKVVQEWLDE